MDRLAAFFDANVLYPAPLRNLLMRLALRDLFRAKWSQSVHDEWIEAALRDRPKLDRKKLERTRALMDAHVRDCLVEGYEALIEGLVLPDPGDRHVLAAAIRGGAEVIVTMNLKDFPAKTLAPYGIEAQHPDTFIMQFIDLDAGAVVAAAHEHRASLRSPPKTVQAYLDSLERQGLIQTVASLRTFEEVL
jgi:predicted nucleic acid-binding protein